MSGETATPAPDSTPAPAPSDAAPSPAAASAESAAPASEAAEEFIPDNPESEPKAEAEGEEGKPEAKAEAEADDFLAETDDDDAKDKADSQADAKPEGAPEAYQQFTLPDGMEIDADALAKATPVFRELGLDQEGAQKLVSLQADIMADAVQSYHDTLAQGHAERLKAWADEVKADPEFGASNLSQSKQNAARVLAVEPAARKALVEYGLDRNPAVFRLLAKLGAKLSEDTLVREDTGAPEKTAPMRDADIMYS